MVIMYYLYPQRPSTEESTYSLFLIASLVLLSNIQPRDQLTQMVEPSMHLEESRIRLPCCKWVVRIRHRSYLWLFVFLVIKSRFYSILANLTILHNMRIRSDPLAQMVEHNTYMNNE